jgi:hypothetical protein
MIEIFQQQITEDMTAEEKSNRVRELLQIIMLKIIYDKDFFNNLAFTGGTALRILFDIKRFSEDLDFSLVNKDGYDFSGIHSALINGLKLYGLKAESKPKTESNVHSAMFKFPGLLKPLGISSLESQKISVKLEVDSNPPKGGKISSTVVNKVYMFNVVHFDLPSMFATKLHACFCRKFTKGRDFYDFVWYVGKKTKPNYTLLNNAVIQTEGHDPGVDEHNFKKYLLENIQKIDFDLVRRDVERFLEDKSELKLLNLKTIQSSIEPSY